MAAHSFIFIPDISGFTEFVKSTEVTHSQHIISELLEVIIDANELDMTVSEIEGDAVLFYRDTVPTVEEIERQARNMFLKFHEHISSYSTRRVCHCGACSTAEDLSLKFVAHCGEVNLIKVKNFEKPYGSAVILAHRLLKNSIDSNEYLLITDELISRKENTPTTHRTKGNTDYEDVGLIHYEFTSLEPLRKEVKTPNVIHQGYKSDHPFRIELFIDASREVVFERVINFDFRLQWNQGIETLEYDHDKINRIGATHTCVVNKKNVEFETITNEFGKEDLVYGERIISPPFFLREIANYFVLSEESGGTKLTFEIHMAPKGAMGQVLASLTKRILKKNVLQNLADLKELCETNQMEEVQMADV